jgi:hypothetical protein
MATLDSSNILDGNTIEPTDILQLYDAFTPGGGTTGEYNVTVSGSLIGNASTATSASYALSSSYAVTASYALNGGGGGTVTQITSQGYSNAGNDPVEASFKFYAGTVEIISNSGATADFAGLAGKTLGTNVWVTATIQGAATDFTSDIVTIRTLSDGGALVFETNSVPNNTIVHFHVIYVAG